MLLPAKTYPFALQNIAFCSSKRHLLQRTCNPFIFSYLHFAISPCFFLPSFLLQNSCKDSSFYHTGDRLFSGVSRYGATALQRYICWNLHFNLHNTARSHAATLSHLLFQNVMNTAS